MTPRRCVISLATEDRRYAAGLDRLERSLERVGFTGDVVARRPGTYPEGCPPHSDVPFAFKPYCFVDARRRGHESVLWLDARCVAIRELGPLFDEIEERGYLLFRNRELVVGEWASDLALELYGLSREDALELPEVNAAAMGLDLRDPLAVRFLESWYGAAGDGRAFRGVAEPLASPRDYWALKSNRSGMASSDRRVRGHRHDQTVAGILAHQLGMTLSVGALQLYGRGRRYIAPTARILVDRDVRSLGHISLARRFGPLIGAVRGRPRRA